MTDLARLADRLAIEDLNAAFAFHLDHGEIEPLVALFTEDAVYTNGARRSEGRAEIEAFFRARTAAGPRTSRHLMTGLRIRFESDTRAKGTSVWLSFAANGVPPIENCEPFMVADFIDHYARGDDGVWRIARRHIEPVFRNPAIPPPGARQS